MLPWILLDRAQVPGGGELRLWQRGQEFSIRVGTVELMNSRRGGSEAALARHACERLQAVVTPRVLIGGLGLGFTLRAALDALGPRAEVVVAELVPEVVAWARGPLAGHFAGCLDDGRVRTVAGDVGELIRAAERRYDAILLDVDNGPAAQVRDENGALYDAAGLAAAARALRPDGVLAVWSEAPDPRFAAAMRRAGFAVDDLSETSGRRRRGARHVIWLAQRS